MPFQPNVVILKGRATDRCLPQTVVHIFSQWGSLMCEQGSGRAVNRSFYEGVQGELGSQWRGLSHVCPVSTRRPGLFVLMAAWDWWCLVYTGYESSKSVPSRWEADLLDCNRAAGVAHLAIKSSEVKKSLILSMQALYLQLVSLGGGLESRKQWWSNIFFHDYIYMSEIKSDRMTKIVSIC